MDWKERLVKDIKLKVSGDKYWELMLEKAKYSSTNIHLAVLVEPFLSLILGNKKKIESRFSINKIAPFQKISKGDLIVLKKSGGPVKAICEAGAIIFYPKINKSILREIERKYGKKIGSEFESRFWIRRQHVNYGTLIKLKRIKKVEDIFCKKKDKRGWVKLEKS